jgi:hypothetical protein
MKTTFITLLLIVSFLSTSVKATTIQPQIKWNDENITIQNLSVKVDEVKQTNVLNWQSNDVTGINYFIIEGSSNGTDFKTIGYVFAGEVFNYSFKTAKKDLVSYKVSAITKDNIVKSVSTLKVD